MHSLQSVDLQVLKSTFALQARLRIFGKVSRDGQVYKRLDYYYNVFRKADH